MTYKRLYSGSPNRNASVIDRSHVLVLTSPNVWLLGGVITCSAFNSYLYYSWYPTYLQEGRAVETEAHITVNFNISAQN